MYCELYKKRHVGKLKGSLRKINKIGRSKIFGPQYRISKQCLDLIPKEIILSLSGGKILFQSHWTSYEEDKWFYRDDGSISLAIRQRYSKPIGISEIEVYHKDWLGNTFTMEETVPNDSTVLSECGEPRQTIIIGYGWDYQGLLPSKLIAAEKRLKKKKIRNKRSRRWIAGVEHDSLI